MSPVFDALAGRLRQHRCVPAIIGPTATGKTDLALLLAQSLPVEIISVDSALVYRGMDIGTAKPSRAERARVPHHLIDIRDPAVPYSASEFVADVHRLVEAIWARERIPLLVGGTMMYYHALEQGLAPLPSADETIRRRWLEVWKRAPETLHRRLQEVDPVAAGRISPNDPQRLVRALEVYELTGQPLSALQARTTGLEAFSLIKFALLPQDRHQLHARIAERFHAMLEAGFEDEVRRLYERGDLDPTLPAIRAVGYRQVWAMLAGEYDRPTMIEKGIVATRQLAKRQITWMRKMTFHATFDPFQLDRTDIATCLLHQLAQSV